MNFKVVGALEAMKDAHNYDSVMTASLIEWLMLKNCISVKYKSYAP